MGIVECMIFVFDLVSRFIAIIEPSRNPAAMLIPSGEEQMETQKCS